METKDGISEGVDTDSCEQEGKGKGGGGTIYGISV